MSDIRVGFLGTGFITQFHLVALRQVRGITVSSILRRSRADDVRQRCLRDGLGDPVIVDTIADVVASSDVVVINVPNEHRVAVMDEIAAAVDGGADLVGVACEKPLGRNVPEARQLVDTAARVGLKTAYLENQIFMKALTKQRSQLAAIASTMGSPSLVRSAEEHGGPHSPWFWDPTRLGGGVLMDMGCHSIAVGEFLLTPAGMQIGELEVESVSCDVDLLKWGDEPWRTELMNRTGVDYRETPAEDFATGIINYRTPGTGRRVKSQFTDSWMYEKQGLRLLMDGVGPGYAFETNTLRSPAEVFIGDSAATAIADAESALEKSTARRGLLSLQPNEADLYGYVDELQDMVTAFSTGRDAFLSWSYGVRVTRLLIAAYRSAEIGEVVRLDDPGTVAFLDEYIPAIQRGNGSEYLV